VGPETRQAIFRIRNTEMIQHLEDFRMPAVLVDAMFRFSMICQDEDGNYPIFVPINCEKFYLTIGVNDFHLAMRSQPIRLQSSNPRIDGDSVTNEWVQAIDHNGHVIAMARGLVARKFGFADLTQTSIVNA
jgi:hypothetical protein